MNLYIYGKRTDLNETQVASLEEKYNKVAFIETADFNPLFEDTSPKVVALDPDVVNWKFDNETIGKIQNLKAICLETTGFEWVDRNYCTSNNIVVTNVPHYATTAVAEKCVFMALALAKKFPLFEQEGGMNWDKEFIGEDMFGKSTGIVGFGAIGRALARKLTNMVGANEIYYYSHKRDDAIYRYMEFDELCEKSEYLFVTISNNPDSLSLFNDLARFNPKAKVIIIANGFSEVAERMAKMVEEGKLGGVAFESNDLGKEYKGNVFVTPPNAYYTDGALEKMFNIWVETMLSAADEEIKNRVN